MEKLKIICKFMPLLCSLVLAAPSFTFAQDRSKELLEIWLKNTEMPTEKDAWRYRCAAYIPYILASFHLGKTENFEQANAYLRAIATETNFAGVNLPQAGGGINQEVECSWAIQLLARVVIENRFAKMISNENRKFINKALLDFVFNRSKIANIKPEKIWEIQGSENHHSINYGGYYLALLAHKNIRPNFRLADGHTIAEHVAAWELYWKAFIQGRSQHGIHAEVASSTYERYTMATYFNLMDLSPDKQLQRISQNFLTLILADAAQEYIPSTGVRGGAAARTYKELPLTNGRVNELYNLGYLYGWHNLNNARANQSSITALISTYRAPEILKVIATSEKKPFQYSSRRIGRSNYPLNPQDHITKLSFGRRGEGSILRYSYVTPEYVIGSMSYDPNQSFSVFSDQNRSVGVVDASHAEARIMVVGVGSGGASSKRSFLGSVTGYAEVSSIGKHNVLISARDTRAKSSSGTQIYISNAGGLWENSQAKSQSLAGENYQGGWIFTKSAKAFYAIRIASGTYKIKVGGPGVALELTDMWSPVIIYAGSPRDFLDANDFQNKIINETQFSYENGKLKFVDLNNNNFEYQAMSKEIPVISWVDNREAIPVTRGGPIRYDSRYTFISPYIKALWGEKSITIRHPKMESLVLDFAY